jgi:hypothetical protein
VRPHPALNLLELGEAEAKALDHNRIHGRGCALGLENDHANFAIQLGERIESENNASSGHDTTSPNFGCQEKALPTHPRRFRKRWKPFRSEIRTSS